MKVSYTGFFRDVSGYAEASRRMLFTMASAGFDVTPGIMLEDGGPQLDHVPSMIAAVLQREPVEYPDVNVIHASADVYPSLVQPAKLQTGFSCWETDRLHPSVTAGARAVDVLIVPSAHNFEVFRWRVEYGDRWPRVEHIPLPALPMPEVDRNDVLGLGIDPKTFVFYSVGTWQERKNPRGLLIAYLTSFKASDDVVLVLKVSGGVVVGKQVEMTIADLLRDLQIAPADAAKIKVLAGYWTSSDAVWRLHGRGDCYVTLTRGEAFAIPVLDALTAGNAVIATGWGGQAELLVDVSARSCLHGTLPGHCVDRCGLRPRCHLVPSMLTPVVQKYSYFDGSQRWAEPDLCAAGAYMQESARVGRLFGHKHDLSEYGPDRIGELLRKALRGD